MTPARSESNAILLAFGGAFLLVLLWALRDIVILIGLALLLAYVLDPLVTRMERIRIPRLGYIRRGFAAAVVILVLLGVIGWALAFALPRLASEVGGFITRAPAVADQLLEQLRVYAAERALPLDPAIANLKANAPSLLRSAALALVKWLGGVVSSVGQLLGLLVLPLLTYYLLAEREAVESSMSQFLPEPMRAKLKVVGPAVDRALKSYVRGQALVCLIMGTIVAAVEGMLGLPLVLLIGVVVGIAEIVPLIGALVASIAIALIGYSVSPQHAVIGVAAYLVINQLVGLVVTPRVMGRQLKLHPFVITVSVLAGGKLLGPAGVMLALPGAAVIQSLIRAFAPRPASKKAA